MLYTQTAVLYVTLNEMVTVDTEELVLNNVCYDRKVTTNCIFAT